MSSSAHHLRRLRLTELELAVGFFPPGARVLEIGAGAGWQAAELARLGFRVEAVDVAGSAYATERVWPVREYDGHCLPFADASFDVVWSSNVLEHVGEIDAFETEIRRVLAPGGIAVHALPTASWRFWTSLAHYLKLPWLAAELWRKKSAPVALLRSVRLLLPSRHGERGNAWSELWCFSRFFWRRHFERCGFHLEARRPCGLFYTGYDLLGARLPLVIRRALSRIWGSACALYVLRPR